MYVCMYVCVCVCVCVSMCVYTQGASLLAVQLAGLIDNVKVLVTARTDDSAHR